MVNVLLRVAMKGLVCLPIMMLWYALSPKPTGPGGLGANCAVHVRERGIYPYVYEDP
jgi:hypothetical protein